MRRRTRPAAAWALAAALALAAAPARADRVSDGDAALAAHRLDEALRDYEEAARQGSAAGQAGVGRVWLARGRPDAALEAFRRAEGMDPRLSVAVAGEGDVLAARDRCDSALALYRRALQLDRRDDDARLGLANCLVALGRPDEALREIEPGLRGNRTWEPRYLVARGGAYAAKHALSEAGVDFTRARELAPGDPAIRRAIGDFYRGRGTWSLAIPEYRAALAIDSTDARAWTALAQALFYDRQSDAALEAYARAAALDPASEPAQLGLGDLQLRAGEKDPKRLPQARAALEAAVRLAPGDPHAWSLLARAQFALGERDRAAETLARARQLGDSTSLAALSQPRGAHASGAPPASSAAGTESAHALEVAGRTEAADSAYRALLARDSTSRDAAFALGERARILYRRKDYRHALPLFDRALALQPRDADGQFFRGICLRELGRDAEALEAVQRSIALDRTHADRWFWLGALEERRRDAKAAGDAYRRSIALEPAGELAGTAHRQIGFLELLGRRWKAALPWLQRAVELNPKDAQAWLWLAQGEQNAGDRAKASDSYRRVLQLDPQNAEARKGLRSLAAGPRTRAENASTGPSD